MKGAGKNYAESVVGLVRCREERIGGRDDRIRRILRTLAWREGGRPKDSLAAQMAGLDEDGHDTALLLITIASQSIRYGGGVTAIEHAAFALHEDGPVDDGSPSARARRDGGAA